MQARVATVFALFAMAPMTALAASRCQDISDKIDSEYKEVLLANAYVDAGVEVTKRGFAAMIHGQLLAANISLAAASKCPLPAAMTIPGERYGASYLACYKQLLSTGAGGTDCLTLTWKPGSPAPK